MKTLIKTLPNGEQVDPRQRGTCLEPCPFCGAKGFLGAEATYSHNLKLHEMDYAIRCGNCDALGPWGVTAYIAATLWNKREVPRSAHRGKNGRFVVAAVISSLLAFLTPVRAGDPAPKRAVEIEKKFGIEFLKADNMLTPGIGNYRYWLFRTKVALRISPIGFPVPAGADDRTVALCMASAMYGACWYETILEQIIAEQQKKEQAQPSATPQLYY